MLQPIAYYNHVLIKYKDSFYELDCGVFGVHQIPESEFPKQWEKAFCFQFETDISPLIPNIQYSQWANISWFLWNLPILGIVFKKMINPKFNTNCCGYISHLTKDNRYAYLHPNQFQSKL